MMKYSSWNQFSITTSMRDLFTHSYSPCLPYFFVFFWLFCFHYFRYFPLYAQRTILCSIVPCYCVRVHLRGHFHWNRISQECHINSMKWELSLTEIVFFDAHFLIRFSFKTRIRLQEKMLHLFREWIRCAVLKSMVLYEYIWFFFLLDLIQAIRNNWTEN